MVAESRERPGACVLISKPVEMENYREKPATVAGVRLGD